MLAIFEIFYSNFLGKISVCSEISKKRPNINVLHTALSSLHYVSRIFSEGSKANSGGSKGGVR